MTIILILQEVYGTLRDEIVYNVNVTNDNNASSFKYKAHLIGNTETNGSKMIMPLHLNIKHILLVILKQMNQKRSKNRCTTKIFK